MFIFKPLAIFTSDNSEITLPDNSIILDLSKSRRRNFLDKIVKWEIFLVSCTGGGIVEYTNLNEDGSIVKVTFSQQGNYTFRGKVTDRFNLSDYQDLVIKVNPAAINTEFGLKVQGTIEDQLVALSQFDDFDNLKWVRTGVVLSTYSDSNSYFIDNYLDAGYKVAQNLSWDVVKPSPFCTDLVSYETKLRQFLTRYATRLISSGSFIVCENEPTNKLYFGAAPILDYINILKMFVRVCHEFGVKVSDGGMFIEILNLMALGTWPSSQLLNVQKTTAILDAIKTLPVDYVNFHLGIHNDILEEGKIKRAVDFTKAYTSKTSVICQEYHYEDCTSASGIVLKAVNEWVLAGVKILIEYSGDHIEGTPNTGIGSHNDALTIGQTLTPMGIKYKEAINTSFTG